MAAPKKKTKKPSTKNQDEVVRSMWERYDYVKPTHESYMCRSRVFEDYYYGDDKQWNPEDVQKLKNEDRPRVTINMVKQKVNSATNYMVSNKVDLSFLPADDIADDDVASILTKLSMHIDNQNNTNFSEIDLWEDGLIRSRAYVDIRMDYTTSERGSILMKIKNPDNIIPDPDADQYDPSTWADVHEVKLLSVFDIEQMYGKSVAEKLKYTSFDSDTVDSKLYVPDSFKARFEQAGIQYTELPLGSETMKHVPCIRVICRQHKRLTPVFRFIDPVTGDIGMIPPEWDSEKIEQVRAKYQLEIDRDVMPRIRWTVYALNTLLYDEWSPYRTFTVIPFFPYFRYGRTQGLVDDLVDPQNMFNKSVSHELHFVSTTANSGWIIEEDALVNMDSDELEQYGSKTGLVIVKKKDSEIDKIQPNAVPTGMDLIAQRSKMYIDEVSSIPKAATGMSREDVSGRRIKEDKEAAGFNLNRVMDNFNKTRRLIAKKKLELIQDYWTQEMVFRVIGFDRLNPDKAEELRINQQTDAAERILNDVTVGVYDVRISSVPDRDTYHEIVFEEAKALKELGVNVPDYVLVENSHFENRKELADQLKNDPMQQRRAELEMEKMEAEIMNEKANAEKRLAEAMKDKMEVQAKQKESNLTPEEMEHVRELRRIELAHEREMMKNRFDMLMESGKIANKSAAERDALFRKAEVEGAITGMDKVKQLKEKLAQKTAAKPKPKTGSKK